ncbi:MAG: GGDEF domain-containing protein [Burkholderiaceae bacterium]
MFNKTIDSLALPDRPDSFGLLRRMIVRFGVGRSVAALTVLCMAGSLGLTFAIHYAMSSTASSVSLMIATLVPALLTPPLAWSAMQLISRLDRSERTHHYLASHDSLTDLCNRREFFRRISQLYDRAYADDGRLWLLMLDLDRFKAVNEQWGHLAGDRVLRMVADLCRAEARPSDVLGRYGGDEFALLIAGADRETVLALAKRLHTRITSTPLALSDRSRIDIMLSVGIAPFEARECSLDQAIARADEALRHAKRIGRNRICIADGEQCVPLAA